MIIIKLHHKDGSTSLVESEATNLDNAVNSAEAYLQAMHYLTNYCEVFHFNNKADGYQKVEKDDASKF